MKRDPNTGDSGSIKHTRSLRSVLIRFDSRACYYQPFSILTNTPLRQDVVRKIEKVKTDGRDMPTKEVLIAECRHEKLSESDYFAVTKDDATA